MIRLTWLQFRMQVLVAATGLIVVGVLCDHGPHLAHLYATSGLKTCHDHGDCSRLSSDYLDRVKADAVYPVLYFWDWRNAGHSRADRHLLGCATGSRQFESGTFRLAWSQGVSPKRWLAVKLALIGVIAVAVTGLLSFMMMWWSSPLFAPASHRAI